MTADHGQGEGRRRVVIVGGGTAGWMAAAALARFLERGWDISLVESDAIGTVGVGEATIPQIRLFHAALGIDEDTFLRATLGTFKLGILFAGWGAPGDAYMHGFGNVGRDIGLIGFHHYWLRARAQGAGGVLGDHCPNVVAALANRFERGDATTATAARPYLPHAFHVDASLYAGFLRRMAEQQGVRRHEGRIVGVARDPASGDIDSVRLEDGRTVAGDLFLDCSGFRALLLGEALGVGYEDWSHWLPCDRALAIPCARTEPLAPYTRASAQAAGWQWRIPLQHRTGNGLVYCSAALSDEDATATLMANLDGAPLADPRPIHFTTGRRAQAWAHNVVALGLSSGFLEPLESTSIHMVQSAIERLLAFLPGGRPDRPAVAEYNRQTAAETEAIRDFIILHYHANRRPEPFWRQLAAMTLPDRLQARLETWAEAGRMFHDGRELFTPAGWVQVLLGQGVIPTRWHPLADQLSAAELAELMGLTHRIAEEAAGRMMLHADFIARRCRANTVLEQVA
jgi:tryptophan halogenase